VIRPFAFQSEASSAIAQRFYEYWVDRPMGGTMRGLKPIPFYQALEAITGGGKTVILADAVERMRPVLPLQPFVLWLSKGRVVVAQTYANLSAGGKYHDLISSYSTHLLSEYRSEFAESPGAHLFFATVGTFNQRDKERGDRQIYKSDIDVADASIWESLKTREDIGGRRRPLIIVYDEAQNLTDQQISLLFELDPDALIVASATMRTSALLAQVVADLRTRGWSDNKLVTTVSPEAVAESGLIKNELFIGGYQSPMERTIDDMLGEMQRAESAVQLEKLTFFAKAIYVCKTNIVEGNSFQRDDPKRPFGQREAPPILIWRHLVEQKGIDPAQIAVYCNLDFDRAYPKPEDFILFKNSDKDYDEFIAGDFRHIIFNLSLQEGWDDPACYFAYVDKSMGSPIQVEQLVGRALRQPGATRYASEILNSAHFYVRVDAKNVFADVVKKVRDRVQQDSPEVRITSYGLGSSSRPTLYLPSGEMTVPKVYIDPTEALTPVELLVEDAIDYRDSSPENIYGRGSKALVQQRIGDPNEQKLEWISIEHSNPVSARWVFQRAIARQYPLALDITASDKPKFDAKVEIGSRAYKDLERLADEVVRCYLNLSRLREQHRNSYHVGALTLDANKLVSFKNSLHAGYVGLNPLERSFADALDSVGVLWCRNVSQTGYGIPLLSLGATRVFFPDFIAWGGDDVFLLDTTGGHLLKDKAARKLMAIAPYSKSKVRLFVKLISEGRWTDEVERTSPRGYTVWGIRDDRRLSVLHLDDLVEVVSACLKGEETAA
jgi:type III restriction enzyme